MCSRKSFSRKAQLKSDIQRYRTNEAMKQNKTPPIDEIISATYLYIKTSAKNMMVMPQYHQLSSQA